MGNNYEKTIHACFTGYIIQAVINNFVPLLFLTFQDSYGIPLSKITMLVTVNFGLQLLVDLVSVGFVDKIGYRASMIMAHILSAVGLISLAVLPGLLIVLTIFAFNKLGNLLRIFVEPRTVAGEKD